MTAGRTTSSRAAAGGSGALAGIPWPQWRFDTVHVHGVASRVSLNAGHCATSAVSAVRGTMESGRQVRLVYVIMNTCTLIGISVGVKAALWPAAGV